MQERLDLIKNARVLTTDEAIVSVAVRQARVLVDQLRVLQRHVAEFDQTIAAQFRYHRSCKIYPVVVIQI